MMRRSTFQVVRSWSAILIATLLTPLVLIVQVLPLKKTVDRTSREVARYLRDFIEGAGSDWDWDDFESVPITDPVLEAVRRQAARAGPPNPDFQKLAALLAEVEALEPRL